MTWQTYRLSDVVESTQSGFASGEKNVTGGFKHLRMNNIHADGRLNLSLVRTVPQELATAKYRLRQDDVLVCTTNSGKLVGKSAMFGMEGDFAFSNHLTRLRVRRDIAQPAFVQKQLWFKWLHGEIEPLCKHWVNQSTLPKDALLGLDVSLPDIEQQRRIVARLDQITARIDEVKARLDTIPATLKRFRQSILAAACSGRLTADWRKESGISSGDDGEDVPGDWRKCPFNNVLQELRNGISRKPEITPGGVPILRISAVRPCRVILSDHRFLSAPTERELVASLQDGDLLFTRYNGNIEFVGVCGIVRGLGSRDMLYPDKLMRVRLKHDVSPEWVEIFFSSPDVRDAVTACSKSSAGQNGISGADIKNQPILVPSISEQTEIVRRVEALFKQADAIEARYKKARAFVEKLTPSVLAKAFRGELV